MKVLLMFFIMQNQENTLKSYLLSLSYPYYFQIAQKTKEEKSKEEIKEELKELIQKEKELMQKDLEIEKLKKEIEDLKKQLKDEKDNNVNYFLYGISFTASLFLIIGLIVAGSQ